MPAGGFWEVVDGATGELPTSTCCPQPPPECIGERASYVWQPPRACFFWGAFGFSPLAFGLCGGTPFDLLDTDFWKLWLGGRARSSLCSQTSPLCVTATWECLCSVSFGTLVSAWGKGKGNANVPLEQCLLWSKKKLRKEWGEWTLIIARAKVSAGSVGWRPARSRYLNWCCWEEDVFPWRVYLMGGGNLDNDSLHSHPGL